MMSLGRFSFSLVFISFAVSFMFFPHYLSAQERDVVVSEEKIASSEKGPVVEETLVVTATKAARSQDEITQKVDVIEMGQDETILRNGNLSEYLSLTAGTFVNALSRNDANWGSYGGLGPKYNTFLLDGLPIDSFVDTQSLDSWYIERIESQRGASSVLYTSYLSMDFAGNQSPLAGTTNIIMKDRINQPLTRILFGGGSWSTLRGRVYHQEQSGPFHIFLGASFEESDYTNYGTENSWLKMLDDPAYQKSKYYVRTTYVFGNESSSISLFAHHTDHDGDVGRPNRDYGHNYDTVNLTAKSILSEKVQATLNAGYRSYDRRWGEDNYNPPDSEDLSLASHNGVEQEIIPLDLYVHWDHCSFGSITGGLDYQTVGYTTYSENNGRANGNDATASNIGVYLQEEMTFDQATVRLGGRFNRTAHSYDLISGAEPGEDEQDWSTFFWSAGVRWRATDTFSIFANAGNSFLPPSIKSVGGTLQPEDEGVSGKNGQLPNPDLDPESGLAYDLGFDFWNKETWKIGCRGFYNSIDDAIIDIRISDDPSQSKSINAGETTAFGLELEVEHHLNDTFSWFVNYTFTDTDIQNPEDADQDGAQVPFVPENAGNVGFQCSWPRNFVADLTVQYVGSIYDSTSLSGRQEFDPYTIVNLSLQKHVYSTAEAEIIGHLDLMNLTDEKYEMPWQFQDPGFHFMVSLEILL